MALHLQAPLEVLGLIQYFLFLRLIQLVAAEAAVYRVLHK
jgi:hypothetical protein